MKLLDLLKRPKLRDTSIPVPRQSIVVGLIAFVFFTIASTSLSVNYYLNLGVELIEQIMLVVIALGSDLLKTFSLILMNYYKDNGIIVKYRRFRTWYAITLLAAVISIFGTGVVLVNRSNAMKTVVDYSLDISYEQKEIDKIDKHIATKNSQITTKNEQIREKKVFISTLEDNQKTAKDNEFKAISAIEQQIIGIENEISALESEKKPFENKIRELESKQREEDKEQDKTMFVLMAELLNVNPLLITVFSVLLLAIIIEGGIYITSPHPKKILENEKKKEVSKPEPEPNPEVVEDDTPIEFPPPTPALVEAMKEEPPKPKRGRKKKEPVIEQPVEVPPDPIPVKRRPKRVPVQDPETTKVEEEIERVKHDQEEPSLARVSQRLFKTPK